MASEALLSEAYIQRGQWAREAASGRVWPENGPSRVRKNRFLIEQGQYDTEWYVGMLLFSLWPT